MTAVTKFEGMAGKKLSLVDFSAPFANCSSSPCSFYKFPVNEMEHDPLARLDPLLQLGLAVDPLEHRTSPTSSSPT